MKQKSSYRIKLVLVGVVAAIVLGGGHANADFTFGEPVNLGPIVNGPDHDQMPSISADGLELYFMSRRAGGSGDWDIWVSRRETTNDPWSEPDNIGPTVNGGGEDWAPCISADGLELYFEANRSGGLGGTDILVASRNTIDEPWGNPVNLGPVVNTSRRDGGPCIAHDGLELYFKSNRSGGNGGEDLWVSKRPTKDNPWGIPVNLGSTINGPDWDREPGISSDGLVLFFSSARPGYGDIDLWLTNREMKNNTWSEPLNVGPSINTATSQDGASISADGRTLYFSDYQSSARPGGYGGADLWQVSIEPVVDLNGDGIVDSADMCIIVDHWGQDYSLCDIGPMPWGDGIIDIQDLVVLAEHLFEGVNDATLIAHWPLDEAQGVIAYDSAANSDGVLVGGPVWQPEGGMVAGTLQFDGVDDYVSTDLVLNPADPEISSGFSVIAWIKDGAPGQAIMSQADGVNWLCIDSIEGCLMTELTNTGRSSVGPMLSQAKVIDDDWHRIGIVWDGSYRCLHVDGVEVVRDDAPLSALEGSEGGVYIGAGQALDAGSFFSGLIDDIRIYNRAVSP
ncbi:MAG: PD40 domain-containing protein [Phycisphaerae bacterium]|nr:PD40 domain-containing protein [Phycisphaerae bacterium]